MIKKYVCVKEVIINSSSLYNIEKFKKLFNIGQIYEFDESERFNFKNEYYLSEEEINEYFISLENWRELKIKNIIYGS